MKPKQFDIKFDNPQGVFKAGSSVSGNVLLSLEKPLKIKGIKILFAGQANTYWTRRQGKNKVIYTGAETYFYTHTQLYNPGQESAREHPDGNHVYPFSFQLAETLPSSFEASKGQIPISDQETGEVYGCCGSAGSVNIHLDLNKTGYVPGEPIAYTVAITNRSQKTIQQVALILNQLTTYTGISNAIWSSGNPKLHPKTRQFYLMYLRDCHLKPESSRQIQKTIALPSLPPSQLDGCNIIDIKYTIELRVLCGTSITIEKGIIVGTIPIQPPDARLQLLPSAPGNTLSNTPLSIETGGLPTYEEALAPPPSYTECVCGRTTIMDNTDDSNTSGDNNWAPSYTYYDFSAFSQQTNGGQPLEVVVAGQSHEINDDDDDDD